METCLYLKKKGKKKKRNSEYISGRNSPACLEIMCCFSVVVVSLALQVNKLLITLWVISFKMFTEAS